MLRDKKLITNIWLLTIVFVAIIVLVLLFNHSDKVNNLILVFTAYIVAIYTREAYLQRLVSVRMLNHQFTPIIVPYVNQNLLQNGNLNLALQNVGQGLATRVTVYIDGKKIVTGDNILPNDQPKTVHAQASEKLQAIIDERKDELSVKLAYYDINDIRYEITGIKYILDTQDPATRYNLNSESWKLSR